ncbi:Mitochondrial inner membrane protease subunit 1 [Gracilariopsis chorda]|uniref:Mitochondrial inner membrane protease subunit 1 n=1 Tax=Gracilariopsis chorda TaxID=448386 RepID=A0A2V3IPB4_9FLOR|nr:Mitochondrial inner membrane protease subunit 1 [Gracilariopsis chorda]|eukprot:PXF43926.1 Mitochondrial inner membrane protease subunit 1 [Gracilariopsis chorda]
MAVGPSMEPTLSARGDVLLTARMTPRAGDIVVAVKPTDADTHVVKRLVRRQRCPPHHVWLRGDNAPRSLDSRHYGAVPDALLRGVVVARLWPPRRVCGRRALRTCAAPPKHQRE